jgi:hypothetical protein
VLAESVAAPAHLLEHLEANAAGDFVFVEVVLAHLHRALQRREVRRQARYDHTEEGNGAE